MLKIIEDFPYLVPYENDLNLRVDLYKIKKKQLLGENGDLASFANGHKYYGFHRTDEGWIYREWAPAADQLYLTGDFNEWHWLDTPLTRIDNGDWEVKLPASTLDKGSKVMLIVKNGDRLTQHLPAYTRRAIQDWNTQSWCAEIWEDDYHWDDEGFKCDEPLLIYEAHIGMSSEEYKIATYREFADNVLPHVKDLGYNAVQLMAVMEHPYYGSFGYQVSNFFAPSSRFGYPDELKYLVDKAHNMGIRVLLDLVHSHAVGNTLEGLNMLDGTVYQYFHDGGLGDHPAWGTKLFNYDKPEVLHFLLSNLKYWLEEYHLDGFRFDGVTSMLYHHHGLGHDFDNMDKYFSMDTDTEAVTYLMLANELIHQIKPDAITIAEDMSGMPGMCQPVPNGGIGFNYRLAMGTPDMWIKLIKEYKDEDWGLYNIYGQLTNRNEGTVAYVESHDQALVGDKTVMFRLADANMYYEMGKDTHTFVIDRAMALHKMIRLITIAAGGNAYLNFMGNEFGHPEWIDFPREGNGNSFKYCRRQWSLLYNPDLKFQYLNNFDHDMVHTIKHYNVFDEYYPNIKWVHESDHVIAFERGGLVFVFNFSPTNDYVDYTIPVSHGCDHYVLFTSDDARYGGYERISRDPKSAFVPGMEGNYVSLYLPSRTCMVLVPSQL
ncbi:MAG: alpha amylase C-terminal domain-containing protein [Erysipelotrichaceae bacterium]|nr:alpha amylase C-terminal domain-containing protein [Erysipelotrichaceae bacterium]